MTALAGPSDIGQKAGDEIRLWMAAVKIWRGAAVGVIDNVGYATNVVVATAGMQFVGVALETADNTLGTPGTVTQGAPGSGYSNFIRIGRRGLWPFVFTGTAPTQANLNDQVWFTDNATVSLTAGKVLAGTIAVIDEAGVVWIDITSATGGEGEGGDTSEGWAPLSASGAIDPHDSENYIITKAGVAALTLAAPTAVVDDGKTIVVSSSTLYAHTLTATGLLSTGTASVNLATFAAYAGAGLVLKAYNGLWQVISSVGITFT